ncbi:hypothetical protein HPB50_008838 [Hyalomma asiaticum]|uniref:Uncharacterized protein n=1 Tax=Hyalomma asiaticum TaxID=266040 RepID=A0ACB7TDC3_HYAAI|nr:hypothetical protein HPB50_008838 [Hyalomma asiaticum]
MTSRGAKVQKRRGGALTMAGVIRQISEVSVSMAAEFEPHFRTAARESVGTASADNAAAADPWRRSPGVRPASSSKALAAGSDLSS